MEGHAETLKLNLAQLLPNFNILLFHCREFWNFYWTSTDLNTGISFLQEVSVQCI